MNNILMIAAIALPLTLMVGQAHAESVSCVLENNKVLTMSNLASQPTYSYGTAGKAELTLPTSSASSRVYKGTEMFSGGGSRYVAFTSGVYTYVVYKGDTGTWDMHGLRVYKNADIIMEKRCKQYGALEYNFDAVSAPTDDLPY
ncbi:hypothetical protein [Oceanisphaera sp. W20_SRM_FM3]|uniref:hypothetical protein n=1 Tax=Oceanisphaera sp. W20_SRM_FM3 TaxID=3240267 RepID=UPI003F974CA4